MDKTTLTDTLTLNELQCFITFVQNGGLSTAIQSVFLGNPAHIVRAVLQKSNRGQAAMCRADNRRPSC